MANRDADQGFHQSDNHTLRELVRYAGLPEVTLTTLAFSVVYVAKAELPIAVSGAGQAC